jgi:hypothetical protein
MSRQVLTSAEFAAIEDRGSRALVVALALAAAVGGFAGYLYLVPFRGARAELKRREAELRAAQTAVEVSRQELVRLRPEVQGTPGQDAGDLALRRLKAELAQRLTGAQLILARHHLLVRFAEEAAFESRGPWLSKSGLGAVQTVAQALGGRAHRVLVAAPMGSSPVPRWVRDRLLLETPGDLSAARAGNTMRALVKAGLRTEAVLTVVGSLSADEPGAPATLELELEP